MATEKRDRRTRTGGVIADGGLPADCRLPAGSRSPDRGPQLCRVRLVPALIVLLVLLSAGSLTAAAPDAPDGSAIGEAERQTGLQTIDWVLIGLYASSTIGLGWFFSRRQKTTSEYFVGSGDMHWFLVGVSLFATLLSTISYLSVPGEVLGKGPVNLASLLALPLVFAVVGFVLLPVYMRYRVTSAYELLEQHLGISVRLLGVAMFLLLRLVWMALLVYLAAKALTVMMDVEEKWIPAIVLATGLVSVIYTSLGGLRAVVITDLVQTILLFGGALLVLVLVTIDFGGFGWFPTRWEANWDTQPIFSLNPGTRVTLVGSIANTTIWYICTAAGDQVSVQRFMATRDVTAARRAFATQLSVGAVVSVTLALVGLALLSYFQQPGVTLPDTLSLKDTPDQIFPRYISHHLPAGVSGLVVAAMFAAAMSSIDSGVNSITAVVTTDLLERFGFQPKTDRGGVLLAKILAFVIGGIVVTGSLFVGLIEGNITTVTSKTVNLLVTPIFCLFFFALFVPKVRPLAVWIGWACGVVAAFLVGFSGDIFGRDPVTGYDPVSFQWIGTVAVTVNISVGLTANWLLPRGKGANGTDQPVAAKR